MKKTKWLLVLLAVLVAMPSHAINVDAGEGAEVLKFEDIESLIKNQNPTVKINDNTKKNLRDSKQSLKDAMDDKEDLEDAIDDIDDAIDGLNDAIDSQNALVEDLVDVMAPPEEPEKPEEPGTPEGPEDENGSEGEEPEGENGSDGDSGGPEDEGNSNGEGSDGENNSDNGESEGNPEDKPDNPEDENNSNGGESDGENGENGSEEGNTEGENGSGEENEGEEGEGEEGSDGEEPGPGPGLPGPGDMPGMPGLPGMDLEEIFSTQTKAQIQTIEYVKALYKSNISSLEQQKESLESQLDEFDKFPSQELQLDKSIFQIDMATDSLVWGAKNLYLACNGLNRQRAEMVDNLELLDDQIDIVILQEELGMATSIDRVEISNQREEMIFGIKSLDDEIANIKRDLNVMLGRDVNKDFQIEGNFTPDEEAIAEIDYYDDLKAAKANSNAARLKEFDYDIKYEDMKWIYEYGSSDELKSVKRELENVEVEYEEEIKNVKSVFSQIYYELQNKVDLLNKERKNLKLEKEKYEMLELRYDLEMISEMELKQGYSDYNAKENVTQDAEQELFQILLQYESLLEGMDFTQ